MPPAGEDVKEPISWPPCCGNSERPTRSMPGTGDVDPSRTRSSSEGGSRAVPRRPPSDWDQLGEDFTGHLGYARLTSMVVSERRTGAR